MNTTTPSVRSPHHNLYIEAKGGGDTGCGAPGIEISIEFRKNIELNTPEVNILSDIYDVCRIALCDKTAF